MKNKFKRALSSVLAFAMVLSCLTVMNVSSVFAGDTSNTISWSMTDNTQWYVGGTQLSSTSFTASQDNYSTVNNYTLTYYAGSSDVLNDKGSATDKGLKMNGAGKSWTQRYFYIDVPAGATVTISAEANGTSNTSNLSYQWGATKGETSSDYTTDTSKTTNTSSATSYDVKNSTAATKTLYFTFLKKQTITAITMTLGTTEPEVTLSPTSVKCVAGSSVDVTATALNFTGDVTYTTAVTKDGAVSDDVTVTESNGTITAAVGENTATGNEYTVTATATAGEQTASANFTLTVVEPGVDVTVSIENPVTSVVYTNTTDSTKTYTFTANSTQRIDYGTYDVAVTNAAPLTYSVSYDKSITLSESTDSASYKYSGSVTTNTDVSFEDSVYNSLPGKTYFWGYDSDLSVWSPSSFGYLDAIQNYSNVKTAGAVKGETSDSDVYMYVDTGSGKINTVGRKNNAQFNSGTVMYVPVCPGSKVTLTNYTSGDGINGSILDANGNVLKAFTYSDSPEYTYEGTTNSYIAIKCTNGGSDSKTSAYFVNVSVTTPNADTSKFIYDQVITDDTDSTTVYVIGRISKDDIDSANTVGFGFAASETNAANFEDVESDTVYSGLIVNGSEIEIQDGYYYAGFKIKNDAENLAQFYASAFSETDGIATHGSANAVTLQE